MFGCYRYVLSFLVVLAHLSGAHLWTGAYAVFGFYTVSGFLMTRILHDVYGFDPKGVGRYLLNRAFRLYPVYWCGLVVSCLLLLVIPQDVTLLTSVLKYPPSLMHWVVNVTALGLHYTVLERLVPPAWSLNVEIIFYLMLPVLCRRRGAVAVWFVLSCAYTVSIVLNHAPFAVRYFEIAAASLPFSAGSLIWHVRHRLPRIPAWALATIIALYLANLIWAETFWHDPLFGGLYVSLALGALILCGLSQRAAGPKWFGRLDELLGRLAYPIFVMHWQVGAMVLAWVLHGNLSNRAALFWITLLPVNLLSLVVHLSLESPMERLRQRVRAGAARASASAAAAGA